jgi:hypothetical protein
MGSSSFAGRLSRDSGPNVVSSSGIFYTSNQRNIRRQKSERFCLIQTRGGVNFQTFAAERTYMFRQQKQESGTSEPIQFR